jgi:beta-hydroxylase
MLRFYNKEFPHVQQYFPQTMRVVQACGSRIRLVMFSVLLPHHRIKPHTGPFRGSMRYHLGLQIPQHRERCFIEIDGQRHSWEEGRSLLFDDTYVHQVYNATDERRIVLFLDVQRTAPSLSPIMNAINHWISHSPIIHTISALNDANEVAHPIDVAHAVG